jgi:hypothetical protein
MLLASFRTSFRLWVGGGALLGPFPVNVLAEVSFLQRADSRGPEPDTVARLVLAISPTESG